MSESITYLTGKGGVAVASDASDQLEQWLRARIGEAPAGDAIANAGDEGVRFTHTQQLLVLNCLETHEQSGDSVDAFSHLRDRLKQDAEENPYEYG